MVSVVLLLAGAAAYWFLLRPDGEAPPPEPGEVVTLEPIQVSLAGGHYLKVGIALQLTADAAEAEGSKALDATIPQFSGRPLAQLTDGVGVGSARGTQPRRRARRAGLRPRRGPAGRLPGGLAAAVGARRLAEVLGQAGQRGRDDSWVDRSDGVVVEVDGRC